MDSLSGSPTSSFDPSDLEFSDSGSSETPTPLSDEVVEALDGLQVEYTLEELSRENGLLNLVKHIAGVLVKGLLSRKGCR